MNDFDVVKVYEVHLDNAVEISCGCRVGSDDRIKGYDVRVVPNV